MTALFAFARANEAGWTDLEALGWYLTSPASEMIIAVPKRKADGCRRRRHCDVIPGTVNPEVLSRYVGELWDGGMKLDFVKTA